MQNTNVNILSQIQKAHSIGSVATMISFILNVFVSRMEKLESLAIPLIFVVSLTIIGSAYFFFQSLRHKDKIEKPLNNNIAFIFRIVLNLVMLALILF